MVDYEKLLQVPRATKARLETIKLELLANTIVYATDTKELGIKLSNGNIEYFMNATDINASKQDKLIAGDNITIDPNTNVISTSGGGGGIESVDWEDVENKPELYDKSEIDLMLGDIDSVLDSILDGGLIVGYNVSYKSSYFSNEPDWISITLTFIDDTTESYEINIGGTYPSDWEQQTGTPINYGTMDNPYVWNNVKSVSITANSPGGSPYVIVNSVNVGATYNETLDNDIIVQHGGGSFGGGPGEPGP